VFRIFENMRQAAERLHASDDPALQERADTYERLLRKHFVRAFATRLAFHGRGFRARWRRVVARRFARRPLQSVWLAALSLAAFPVLQAYSAFGRLHHALSRDGDQPETRRNEYAPASGARSGSRDAAARERGGAGCVEHA
jgi:hypothetical protein